ncbi:MAG: hypothetical protein WCK84_11820 [Bacteroidota bacterium]
MKTRIFLSVLAIGLMPVVFLMSCSKIKELTSVDITYKLPRTNFTYTPVTLKSGEQILYSALVWINVDSLLSANGISGGAIENSSFSQFSITINTPPEANFGWLQSARVTVSDNAGFSSPVQIGIVNNNGGTGKKVTLTVNSNNIPFGSNGFYLRIYATLTGPLPYQWVQMYFDSELKMTLNAL